MKTIAYSNLRPGHLIQKFDERWCPVSGQFRTNLDDMLRFSRSYRRLDGESIRKCKWRRPVGLTSTQKRTLERTELAKINATRKQMDMEPISTTHPETTP